MASVEPRNHPGEVEIGLRYSRHLGPRYVSGSVVLQFSLASSFSFASRVTWPDANYDGAVREGVEDALRQRGIAPDAVAVVLKAIEWDAVASCMIGFRQAACAATLAAFVV